MNYFEDMKKIIFDISNRIRNKNFSGEGGLAVKNSIYQFSTTIVSKLGALIFTVILARMLMPELFGLYSLALSTILIFATLSELGIGNTLVRFVSKEIGKGKRTKVKSYISYLGSVRLFLISISMMLLIVLSRLISNNYYHKPIFLALLAGSLYILFGGINSFLQSVLQSLNYFKGIFYREIIFQISRIILIPLIVFISLKEFLSNELLLSFIILSLAIVFLISSLSLFIFYKGKSNMFNESPDKISLRERKNLKKFILPVSATIITATFFGYMDIIMVGRFVSPNYIGYYRAASSLISAMIPLISFSPVLLPIFSRMKSKKLEEGLSKTISISLLLSLVLSIFVISFSQYIIRFIYGSGYIPSTNLLIIFSLLLISAPIISIYESYFIAKGKPQIIVKLLFSALIVNVIFNAMAIFFFLKINNLYIIYGVTIVTVFSRWFYMFSLIFSKNRKVFRNI